MKSTDIATNALPPETCNWSMRHTALWAGISMPTLWRQVKLKKLPVIGIGGRTLTTPEGRAGWKATWPTSSAA